MKWNEREEDARAKNRQSKTSPLAVCLSQQAPGLSEEFFRQAGRLFCMKDQEVIMDNFVNYSHVNPLKEPDQPCECQCVAYRLKGLKWFRENVEVFFAGFLEDGQLNHYHLGSVSHAEGSNLYAFGTHRISSVDFCLLDLSVGPWHCVDWPIFPEPSSDLCLLD